MPTGSIKAWGKQMAWFLLGIAGVLEIAFAFAMKWSEGFTRPWPALVAATTGIASIFLLSQTLRALPVGTAYAVWTGIGAAGTAIIGMVALGEAVTAARLVCIALIICGVGGLRLVSGAG
jgi:quaternary ammonium compound-resistance protein SugE